METRERTHPLYLYVAYVHRYLRGASNDVGQTLEKISSMQKHGGKRAKTRARYVFVRSLGITRRYSSSAVSSPSPNDFARSGLSELNPFERGRGEAKKVTQPGGKKNSCTLLICRRVSSSGCRKPLVGILRRFAAIKTHERGVRGEESGGARVGAREAKGVVGLPE